MEFLQKLSGAALLSAALLFTACQKDKDPANSVTPVTPSNQKACKLLKESFIDGESGELSGFYKYTYDNNNKITSKASFTGDSILMYFVTYVYNAQGKAIEEITYNKDSTATGKQLFTYNSAGLLSQVDFQGVVMVFYPHNPHKIVLHYNNKNQRIKAEFYSSIQPNTITRYFEYTYNGGTINAKEYDVSTNPATFFQNLEFKYDTSKSRYHALGYLDAYTPDLEKHNLVYYREYIPGYSRYNSAFYYYNTFGYPVRASTDQSQGWGPHREIYEYDCN